MLCVLRRRRRRAAARAFRGEAVKVDPGTLGSKPEPLSESLRYELCKTAKQDPRLDPCAYENGRRRVDTRASCFGR